MQVFRQAQGLLGGIDEALAVLRLCRGQRPRGWQLGGRSGRASPSTPARRGDPIRPWETVLMIEGDTASRPPETVYLGTLARARSR